METSEATVSSSTGTIVREEELIAEGRRSLVCNDFSSAVLAFQEACQIMSDKYGQMSEKLAKPYFLYGKSLLELARQENSVLGGGISVPPEEQDSSDSEEENEAEEGDDENEKSIEKHQESEDTELSSAQPSSTTHDPLPSNNSEPPIGEMVGDINVTGEDATSEGGKDESQEEVSNLQLAWEVLEVARVLCQKEETRDNQLLLAEVSLLLGEVSLESDQYEQAIEDFIICLKLREALLSPDDRKLAEVHFHLGLTYALFKKLEESVEEYCQAKQVLELRKEKLQLELEKVDEKEREKLLTEIEDITKLLPEIDSKITDAEDTVSDQQIPTLQEEESESTVGFGKVSMATTGDVPVQEITAVKKNTGNSSDVTDISHLVRRKLSSPEKTNGHHSPLSTTNKVEIEPMLPRKRPAEESLEEEEIPAKKLHSSNDAHISSTTEH